MRKDFNLASTILASLQLKLIALPHHCLSPIISICVPHVLCDLQDCLLDTRVEVTKKRKKKQMKLQTGDNNRLSREPSCNVRSRIDLLVCFWQSSPNCDGDDGGEEVHESGWLVRLQCLGFMAGRSIVDDVDGGGNLMIAGPSTARIL